MISKRYLTAIGYLDAFGFRFGEVEYFPLEEYGIEYFLNSSQMRIMGISGLLAPYVGEEVTLVEI